MYGAWVGGPNTEVKQIQWLPTITTHRDQAYPCHILKVALGLPMECHFRSRNLDLSMLPSPWQQLLEVHPLRKDRNSRQCLLPIRMAYLMVREVVSTALKT